MGMEVNENLKEHVTMGLSSSMLLAQRSKFYLTRIKITIIYFHTVFELIFTFIQSTDIYRFRGCEMPSSNQSTAETAFECLCL